MSVNDTLLELVLFSQHLSTNRTYSSKTAMRDWTLVQSDCPSNLVYDQYKHQADFESGTFDSTSPTSQ